MAGRVGVPQRAVTGRALVLGALIVLMIVVLASPLNRYFNSRSDASDAQRQLQDDRAKVSELQQQLELWSDPGFIQQQARNQLQFAMPGDTVYVVVDKGQESDIDKTAGTDATGPAQTWNDKLWTSVKKAS
jgi:cell division protein FtsB